MANSFLVPPNDDPVSSVLKTGSYTIPAGQYARVDVIGDYSLFSIDGVTVIEAGYATANVNSASSGGTLFTVPAGRVIRFRVTTEGSGGSSTVALTNGSTTTVIISMTTAGAFESSEFIGYAGDVISYGIGAGNHDLTFRGQYIDQQNSSKTFYVPTGTALVGARYVVSLYNSIV